MKRVDVTVLLVPGKTEEAKQLKIFKMKKAIDN